MYVGEHAVAVEVLHQDAGAERLLLLRVWMPHR
jgi:hypothetical protein